MRRALLVALSLGASVACEGILGADFSGLEPTRDAAAPPPGEASSPSPDAAPGDAGAVSVDSGVPEDAGDADAEADAASDAGTRCTLPVSAGACATLALWFSADQGLACSDAGVATSWADLSGNTAGATTYMDAPGIFVGPHLGPACGPQTVAAGHVIGGIAVPFFNAPDAMDGGPYVDGTFDIDLSALDKTPFTVFIVERRWRPTPIDADGSAYEGEAIYPGKWLMGSLNEPSAGPFPPSLSALQIGYVGSGGCAQIDCDLTRFSVVNAVPQAPDAGPAPLSIDVFWNDTSFMSATVNGVALRNTNNNSYFLNPEQLSTDPAALAATGMLGNAVGVTTLDDRFFGDIAEILVFTSALGPGDQAAVQQHLQAHWSAGVLSSDGSGGNCP